MEIAKLTPAVDYYQLAFYAALGVILSGGLLIYCHRLSAVTRYHLLAIALSIASLLYVVFALLTFNLMWIAVEVVGLVLFLLFIWMAYQYSFWFIALGWLLHIVWDIGVHPHETAPYVPQWYAWLCVGFDAVMALYLSVLLVRHSEKT